MDYSEYKELKISRLEPGILEIVMRAEPGKLSVTNALMHGELARIWLDVEFQGLALAQSIKDTRWQRCRMKEHFL